MTLRLSRIRTQILSIAIMASIFTAFCMFIGGLTLSLHFNKTMLETELKSIALMMAENSQTAFELEDTGAAERQIRAFPNIKAVIHAELKHADGQLLAHYQKNDSSPNYINDFLFKPITVHQSVSVDNKYLGSLKITASAAPMVNSTMGYSLVALGVLLLSIIFASLLSYRLQKRISNPIDKLHAAINRVTHSSDDFFQLPVETQDELGEIYRSFNEMLTELEERNKTIEHHAQELGATLDIRNQQISEEERKRILWLQNLARFLKHELKNTMLGFRSSLDMIERRSDDEKIHQYIDRARNSIIFMGKLLHNVGETSGLEAELLEEEFERIDLSETIREWLIDYSYATGVHSINFNCDEGCFIQGNTTRLMQMVEKLAANAASHSKEGTLIDLSVRKFEHEIVLSVANQGAPLPEERGGIFELFVSMRESGQKTSDNVGLGLYIVRIIAQAHDGYVEAGDLENAEGAVFSVHLPRHQKS